MISIKKHVVLMLMGALLFQPFILGHHINETSSCNGYVLVIGRTNINRFMLKSNVSAIELVSTTANKCPVTNNSVLEISIPLTHFETDNSILYRDFLELMKAETYPKIAISIPYIELHVLFDNNMTHMTLPVNITMVGITQKYMLSCTLKRCLENPDFFYVIGDSKLKMTDFNLNPPEKFYGMIQVKNELLISFGFSLKIQEKLKISWLESQHQNKVWGSNHDRDR